MKPQTLTLTASSAVLLTLGSIGHAQTDARTGEATSPQAEATGPKRMRVTPAAPAQSPVPAVRPADDSALTTAMHFSPERDPAEISGFTYLVGELLDQAFDGEETEVDGDNLIQAALQRDSSDLPEIRERGYLRLAVAPDPLMIAYEGERAIGVAMDLAREFQKYLAKQREVGTPTVVVPVPTPRSKIAEAVEEGRSDFAPLIVHEHDAEEFDFTRPLMTDVNDVVVLGPEAPEVESIEDLTDVRLFVSEGGRYAEDLVEFNAGRIEMGEEPLQVRYVDERLQDYDLMEMAAIGLIPATVMTGFKADFWSQIYTTVEVRHDLELTEDGRIAWAVRTNNPKLLKALDGFAEQVKEGTLVGNTLHKRYYGDPEWIENLDTDEARELIADVEPVIQEYSERYGFESDLVLAQAYQESQLDQSRRSHVGAIGVMQVMPTTAADPVVDIPDVTELESNVEAGIKYLRWLRDTYYSEPDIAPLDRTLFSFAAYNAGPGGLQRARRKAREMGLDPDVWFENVEVAITKVVSREPAVYVRNIFKYYVSYRLMQELEAERKAARKTLAEVEEEVEGLPLEDKLEALEEARIVLEGSVDPAGPGEAASNPAAGPERERLGGAG